KPKVSKTEFIAEASYGITSGGDPNSSANATFNLPLVLDKLAVRATIYNDRRGGYIDNVPSLFTHKNSDLGNFYTGVRPVAGVCPNGLPGTTFCAPVGAPVANNNMVTQPNSNPVQYTGLRVAGLLKINDDWDVLIAQSYQNMEA